MPRGAKPGEYRGGRKKGTKNRRTLEAEEIFKQTNFNPLRRMIEMVKNPETSEGNRTMLLRELSQYAYPKRKAVEHSGGLELNHGVAHIPTPVTEEDWPFTEATYAEHTNGASTNGHYTNGVGGE